MFDAILGTSVSSENLSSAKRTRMFAYLKRS